MVGWPGAPEDRLPADALVIRAGRAGVPRRRIEGSQAFGARHKNLSRSKIGFGWVTCRSSVRQAACVYSLIRPLRIGFRRICCVPTSVTAVRGATRSSSGARAGRCPGAAGPCCSAAGIRPGRRAGVPRRGSARGRGARGAGCRRGVRRSRSAWTAVRRILAPVARKTASKERVKFDPRSRIRNLISPDRSPGLRARLRACCTVHSPAGFAVTPPSASGRCQAR